MILNENTIKAKRQLTELGNTLREESHASSERIEEAQESLRRLKERIESVINEKHGNSVKRMRKHAAYRERWVSKHPKKVVKILQTIKALITSDEFFEETTDAFEEGDFIRQFDEYRRAEHRYIGRHGLLGKHLDAFLDAHELEEMAHDPQIAKELEQHKQEVLRILEQVQQINLGLEQLFIRINAFVASLVEDEFDKIRFLQLAPASNGEQLIILDSRFVKDVYNYRKQFDSLKIDKQHIKKTIIPLEVKRELLTKGSKSLVPGPHYRAIKHAFEAVEQKIPVDDKQAEQMLVHWGKAKKYDLSQANQFKRSADMRILCFAEKNRGTIILSGDKEITETVNNNPSVFGHNAEVKMLVNGRLRNAA